jgi:hypothetical protein
MPRAVREHLQAFLLGAESLPDFHRWFVSWRRTNPDSQTPQTRAIDLLLAEYVRLHRTEPQLKGLLWKLYGETTLAVPVRTEVAPWREIRESFAALFESSDRVGAAASDSD